MAIHLLEWTLCELVDKPADFLIAHADIASGADDAERCRSDARRGQVCEYVGKGWRWLSGWHVGYSECRRRHAARGNAGWR
ncbi:MULTISPECIES: hypothetical protein [unclassified Methylobacterium]|uniref:hypothetical protein n=1 Tax=unclassified Methylobacterium TaxID=2615210 RepID=UPI0016501045|nr:MULTISPECIES: hypothetical protein [unclassified Methylobacterium]